ncbi:MAG: HD domain-containing phosphohydrolase [Burkholderiaceae bacterium]
MAATSKLIAEALELPSELCERIFQAAPLHDVGKISTPDGILLKPGRLTDEEFIVMKQHCEAGWKILHEHSSPVLRLGAEIALAHHEKYDGSGYPNGLAADAIPLHGRIVAVADVFDALVSPRPYKRAWSAVDARLSRGRARQTFRPAVSTPSSGDGPRSNRFGRVTQMKPTETALGRRRLAVGLSAGAALLAGLGHWSPARAASSRAPFGSWSSPSSRPP